MFPHEKEKSPQDASRGTPDRAVLGLQSPGFDNAAHEPTFLGCKILNGELAQGHGENFLHLLIGAENWAGSKKAHKWGYGKTTEAEILLQSSQESSVGGANTHLFLEFPEGCGLEVWVRGIFPAAWESYLPWVEVQTLASADQQEIRLLFLHPKKQDHCGWCETGEPGRVRLAGRESLLQPRKNSGEPGSFRICGCQEAPLPKYTASRTLVE